MKEVSNAALVMNLKHYLETIDWPNLKNECEREEIITNIKNLVSFL